MVVCNLLFGEVDYENINKLQASFKHKLPQGVVGIGDDCAVIPQNDNQSLLITTDLLIEGTHFLREEIYEIH